MSVDLGDAMPAAPIDLIALCQGEHRRLVGLLGLLVGDRHLGEELAQEALTRACRDWEKVQKLDRPAAWLHRVAVNLAMSAHRRRRAEQRMLGRVHSRHTRAVHDADTATVAMVRRALQHLPMELRVVIVLRFYADLSVADTAAVLHLPEGTVKTRTRRALAELRDGGLIETTEVPDAV
jgi:RNA polymerase sigma factor (sigma-70 family)